MLKELAGTLLAGAANQAPGGSSGDPLTTALIGTGTTLALTRGKRPVGIVLLGAGAYLLFRDIRHARAAAAITPPAPALPDPGPPPAASAPAA